MEKLNFILYGSKHLNLLVRFNLNLYDFNIGLRTNFFNNCMNIKESIHHTIKSDEFGELI